MGRSTVAQIVLETCNALWEILQPIYMPAPTEQMYRAVAEEYWLKWNFPNCIGAIDGKHIRIKCPKGTGSLCYNYKGFHSIVLQAVADANAKFLVIEVGGYGKQSDGGTFSSSDLYKLLENGQLNIPPDTPLPDEEFSLDMPHVFVGDEAYPLIRNLLRPYPRSLLDSEKEYFNSRLSRARKCVECAFGIMTAKWRLLWKPIEVEIEFADEIVKAICVLHNVILDHEGLDSILDENVDINRVQGKKNQGCGSNKICTKTGRFVRNYFDGFVNKNKLN
ncbi:uncharacterized protein LOC129718865 isoform X2 [Wyeomyia smithii]|nr:uncharacterized protein LOC129718865 isoform X2 [Wyeomyia smithii]